MAEQLGALAIKVMGDIAEFRTAMQTTQDLAAQAAKRVDDAFNVAGTSVKTFLVGLASIGTIVSFKNTFDGIVAGAAALDDMAERTGVTVERLSAFASVAKLGGHSVESMEGAITKLAKGMAGADEETKGAGNALSFLGIKSRDANGNLRNSGDVFEEVAKKLGEFKDGTGKTALAMDLFGKSGAQILPLMKDMYEQGEHVAKVTAEQAAQAEAYEKSVKTLTAAKDAWKKEVAFGVLPVAADFVQALLDLKKKNDGLTDSVKQLRADGSIEDWARTGALGIANLIDIARAVPLMFKIMGAVIAGAAFNLKAFGEVAYGVLQFATSGMDVAKMQAGWETIKSGFADVGKGMAMVRDDVASLATEYRKGMFADAVSAQFEKVKDATEKSKGSLDGYASKAQAVGSDIKNSLGKSLDELFNKLNNPDVDNELVKQVELLTKGFQAGLISVTKYGAGLAQAYAKSKPFADANKMIADSLKENEDALNKNRQAVEDAAQAMKDGTERLANENATIGMTKVQRDLYNLALQKTIDIRRIDATLTGEEAAMRLDEIEKLYAAREEQIKYGAAVENQQSIWRSLQSTTEDFFTNLFEHGRSAFGNLWTTIKHFFAQLAAQFATKYILQIGVSLLGLGGAGIANAGTGSLLQMLGLGGDASSGGGILGGLLGSLSGVMGLGSGAGLLGAIGGGANLMMTGLMGGGLSGMFGGIGLAASSGILPLIGALGPIGLALGSVYSIAKMFDGANGTGLKFGRDALGQYGDNPADHAIFRNRLGNFAYEGDDADAQGLTRIQAFVTRFNAEANAIAAQLNSTELQQVRDKIGSIRKEDWYKYSGDAKDAASKAIGDLLKDVFGTAFGSINTKISDAIKNFAGNADDLQNYIDALVSIDWKNVSGHLADAVTALASTADGAKEAIALLQSAQTLQTLIGTDFLQAGIDAFKAQNATALDAYRIQGDAVDKLIDAAIAGKASYADLTQGAVLFAQAATKVLADIQAIRASIDSAFTDADRMFQLAGLTNDQKVEWYRQDAEAARAAMAVATDPAEINRLWARIVNDLQAAFNLLSPEQQALAKDDYRNGLAVIRDESTAALDRVQKVILENTQSTIDQIQKGFDALVDKMGDTADKDADTADKNLEAADKNLAAANTPIKIEVWQHTSEVTGGA